MAHTMQTHTLVIVLALGIAGCAGGQKNPAPAAQRSYTVVDATGPFWRFWERHALEDTAAQAQAFQAEVVTAHRGLFGPNVIGTGAAVAPLEARLPPWLADLPPRIDVMRGLSASIQADLDKYDHSFQAAFLDMRWPGTVYFTVSRPGTPVRC